MPLTFAMYFMSNWWLLALKPNSSNYYTLPYTCLTYRFYRATARNATHGIAVGILSVRPSVCLSVRCVYCDKTKWCTADILIPHETAITLVNFWHSGTLALSPECQSAVHSTISLHLGYPRQDDVCYQCLVGIRHCGRLTASWGIYPTCGTRWSVPNRWTKPASVGFWRGRSTLCMNMMMMMSMMNWALRG